MALISRIPAFDVATAVARSIEALLGHDMMLAPGPPAFGAPHATSLPAEPTRSVALPFADGVVGEVTLVVSEQFATAMEAVTPDASLASAALLTLVAAAGPIEAAVAITVNPDWAGEIATETLLTSVDGDFAIVPILENEERVACIVVRVVEAVAAAAAPPPPIATPIATPIAAPIATPIATPIAAPVVAPAVFVPLAAPDADGISLHEFQPLGDGNVVVGHTRSLTLLNDVSFEISAELGRRQLKVREIMALEPGSVIELDKTAGSPVDVLVNGAIVWHGEVVVVDDEFGIRVSEIVVDEY